LKWFPSGLNAQPEQYNEDRSSDGIMQFINKKIGSKAKVKKVATSVVDLTDATFDKIVLDPKKHVLVEFYAPWCGHCKSLAPVWEKLGTVFAHQADVVIARIDADSNKKSGGKFGIEGFPTLKWFPKDKKEGVAYEGGRELSDLVDYVNKNTGSRRDLTGSLPADAGRIEALDEIAKVFIAEKDKPSLITKAKALAKTLSDELAKDADIYVKLMEKIAKDGGSFISAENERLSRLISGGHAGKKIDEFTKRKNVLSSFSS